MIPLHCRVFVGLFSLICLISCCLAASPGQPANRETVTISATIFESIGIKNGKQIAQVSRTMSQDTSVKDLAKWLEQLIEQIGKDHLKNPPNAEFGKTITYTKDEIVTSSYGQKPPPLSITIQYKGEDLGKRTIERNITTGTKTFLSALDKDLHYTIIALNVAGYCLTAAYPLEYDSNKSTWILPDKLVVEKRRPILCFLISKEKVANRWRSKADEIASETMKHINQKKANISVTLEDKTNAYLADAPLANIQPPPSSNNPAPGVPPVPVIVLGGPSRTSLPSVDQKKILDKYSLPDFSVELEIHD